MSDRARPGRGLWPLEGVVKHYPWGGSSLIPSLLDRTNPQDLPWAELWFGTHPDGCALVPGFGDLGTLIRGEPEANLGEGISGRFEGELPFLVKILDAARPLSIQVHPSREHAREGFAREEAAGIPRTAAERNYKDRNHKPELQVALTEFHMLHGFRSREQVLAELESLPSLQGLYRAVEHHGLLGGTAYALEAEPELVEQELGPLIRGLQDRKLPPRDSLSWLSEAARQFSPNGPPWDPGLYFFLLMKLLILQPGQATFQAAGLPHAYLKGACVEVMAASDNVLRCGLTGKHREPRELLRVIDPEVPNGILVPVPLGSGRIHYPFAVEDFTVEQMRVSAGRPIDVQGPAIGVILYEGDQMPKLGAFFAPFSCAEPFLPGSDGRMFLVTVPPEAQ